MSRSQSPSSSEAEDRQQQLKPKGLRLLPSARFTDSPSKILRQPLDELLKISRKAPKKPEKNSDFSCTTDMATEEEDEDDYY